MDFNQAQQVGAAATQVTTRPRPRARPAIRQPRGNAAALQDMQIAAGEQTTELQTETQRAEPQINVQDASFAQEGLRAEVLSLALLAYRTAWAKGQTESSILSVIDFSIPSDQKRLFVMDLQAGTLLFHELVTHGSGSGGNQPTQFSNRNNSHQSSIGLSRTAETYQSSKFGGTALRMDGLEDGVNDNMRDRAIVMHQADYATPEAIEANRRAGNSRLGRSQGCPAMDPRVAGDVIEAIKGGSLVFSYYPDPDWLQNSEYLN